MVGLVLVDRRVGVVHGLEVAGGSPTAAQPRPTPPCLEPDDVEPFSCSLPRSNRMSSAKSTADAPVDEERADPLRWLRGRPANDGQADLLARRLGVVERHRQPGASRSTVAPLPVEGRRAAGRTGGRGSASGPPLVAGPWPVER